MSLQLEDGQTETQHMAEHAWQGEDDEQEAREAKAWQLSTSVHDEMWEDHYVGSASSQDDLQVICNKHETSDTAEYSPADLTEEQEELSTTVDEQKVLDEEILQTYHASFAAVQAQLTRNSNYARDGLQED